MSPLAHNAPVVRKATAGDVPAIARVFGRAFDDYRRGFSVDAVALARLWEDSLAARIGQTTVVEDGAGSEGSIAGFIITVPPGQREQYGDARAGRRRFALMRAELGLRHFWRLPFLFVPMGLAYARRHAQPEELYVSLVGVDPGAQGRGLGRVLLAAAEAEAREHGATAVLLHTASTNARARAAYARAGYQLVSTVRAPWRGPAGIPAYVALRKPLGVDATPRLSTLPPIPPLSPPE